MRVGGSIMKLNNFPLLIILSIGWLAPVNLAEAQPGEYQRLKTQAEKYYAQGSFSRAHKTYAETNALNLTPQEKRWVDFRIGDTLWRAEAGSKTSDPSIYEKAQQQLEFLIRDIKRDEDKDRVWAEIQESLGDFWWQRRDSKNWNSGWQHYQKALDWWAGAKDIDLARTRYLKIVWTIASPSWREPYYYYGYYGNQVPLETLENALKISQTKTDLTRAHYLIAMTLRQQGGDRQERVTEEFEAVLKAGQSFAWYDDALLQYAEWLANSGEVVILENGEQHRENNYVKALELYRRIIKEFNKGETRHYDTAKQRIQSITQPVLGLSVSNIFLPDSEIQFHLNWRNIENVTYSIYPVDLTHDKEFYWMRKNCGHGRRILQPLTR
jgi:alpha-2-macroglobulin